MKRLVAASRYQQVAIAMRAAKVVRRLAGDAESLGLPARSVDVRVPAPAPTAHLSRQREELAGASQLTRPASDCQVLHALPLSPKRQRCGLAEPRHCETIAFLESDRPDGPRAGDAYGDDAVLPASGGYARSPKQWRS